MNVLREHLVKSLKGGQAFVPYKKALDGIKPGLRHKRSSNELHSIWEELEHIRLAQEDIIKYMLEPDYKSPKWPEGYWPPGAEELTDDQWEKTYNGFLNDLNKAVELVNDTEIDLLSIIPHTTSHTYLREFNIIIEHNAYHIGKIVDIRKALGNW